MENSGIHSSEEKKKKRQQTAKNNGDIRFNGTKHDDAEQNGIKDENTQNFTILSTKKKICRALFRIRRPCFKRKCTMRVNSVFRAALKSGVDTSSNLLSDSKSSVTKSYDIFFRRILRLLWLSEISQRKSFQLEMCLPGRLSRSNDFWSAKRNWFHYFQIIKQQLF